MSGCVPVDVELGVDLGALGLGGRVVGGAGEGGAVEVGGAVLVDVGGAGGGREVDPGGQALLGGGDVFGSLGDQEGDDEDGEESDEGLGCLFHGGRTL